MKAEFGEYNLIRSHNMRRFLNSTLLAKPCNASIFFVDFILGHEMDATRAAYYRADSASLKEEYMKYLPSITIQKEIDPETHPDFIKLRNESETYARAAANATVERSELIKMKEEIERMKAEREDLISEIMAEKHIDEENLQYTIELEVQKRMSEPDKDLKKLMEYFKKKGMLIDLDAELIEEEKRAAENAPDW